ncbi:MAG: hypothetical protein DHS20C07_18790 [Methyloligella sp.]|nr:MAG: hypothetical protein DHS20C07_18790 [Methyloligella sp.]
MPALNEIREGKRMELTYSATRINEEERKITAIRAMKRILKLRDRLKSRGVDVDNYCRD